MKPQSAAKTFKNAMSEISPRNARREGALGNLAVATVILRIALAAGLLSAVADRFGLWGHAGSSGVAWGNFDAFLSYTAKLNPWCPPGLVPVLGWRA